MKPANEQQFNRREKPMKTVIYAIISVAVGIIFIKKIIKSSNCTP